MPHTPGTAKCEVCMAGRRALRCDCGGPPETEHAPDCSYSRGEERLQEEHDDETAADRDFDLEDLGIVSFLDFERELVQEDHGDPFGEPYD